MVVVGVEPADDARVRAERAERVARILAASRPHVILAGIGGAGVVLDRVMAVAGPGLEAVFHGQATLAEVAVPGEKHEPVYVPSGVAEAGRAPNREGVARRAERLAAVLRKAGATLVLLVDAGALAAGAAFADLVLPEEAREAAGARAASAPRPAAAPYAVEAEEHHRKRGRWRRHRKRGDTAVARAVAAVTLVAAAVGGWWITMAIFGPEEPVASELAPRPAGAETTASAGKSSGKDASGARADSARAPGDSARAPASHATPPASGREAARPSPRVAATAPKTGSPDARVVERAPALPYSVLIASYSKRSDAVGRARRWAAADDILYLVAPTPVQGRVYYRLFAGAEPSRDAADRLMNRLVQRGRKKRANTWDVRPVSLAFRLGVRSSHRAAAARADSLGASGVSAYLVPAVAAGDTVWQVYAGAFESEDAGAVLARSIHGSERVVKLVTRRGTGGR